MLQPITRLNCSNKGNLEKVTGGATRAQFEHSLLHDSLTTIRMASGLNLDKKSKKCNLEKMIDIKPRKK